MKTPFFSIVIPTYNRAKDLQFALFCLFQQSFKDFEVIISDNCSTDQTKEVISKINDKRIRYSRSDRLLGNALNMKRALKYAQGEYIFFHSDDDFLLYSDVLEKIYKKIIKVKPGYLRINFVSLSMDKKQIFFYKVKNPPIKDLYFQPRQTNIEIINFILNSEPYFISGIIFRNKYPSQVKMIDSDPVPWIKLLFYATKNSGAYLFAERMIVANWSRRDSDNKSAHHIFTLIRGKLRSENFLNFMKSVLNKDDYNEVLYEELSTLYADIFPVVKLYAGNKIMLRMSKRIRILHSGFNESLKFWILLLISLTLPKFVLKLIRTIYLNTYSVNSKVKNNNQIVKRIKQLEKSYIKSRENVFKNTDKIFHLD